MFLDGCSHMDVFLPYSGQIADRVNLRYFITIGMLGIIICMCNFDYAPFLSTVYCNFFTVTEGLILQAAECQWLLWASPTMPTFTCSGTSLLCRYLVE